MSVLLMIVVLLSAVPPLALADELTDCINTPCAWMGEPVRSLSPVIPHSPVTSLPEIWPFDPPPRPSLYSPPPLPTRDSYSHAIVPFAPSAPPYTDAFAPYWHSDYRTLRGRR